MTLRCVTIGEASGITKITLLCPADPGENAWNDRVVEKPREIT